MRVIFFRVNREAFDCLDCVALESVLFNHLRRLVRVFGARCFHAVVCRFLSMDGYEVHKL